MVKVESTVTVSIPIGGHIESKIGKIGIGGIEGTGEGDDPRDMMLMMGGWMLMMGTMLVGTRVR